MVQAASLQPEHRQLFVGELIPPSSQAGSLCYVVQAVRYVVQAVRYVVQAVRYVVQAVRYVVQAASLQPATCNLRRISLF
ncbi:MAG: hypothetical protein KDB14_28650 [Planctomycetales bacterium]|nr:hypothetical protein [Planctomycetales bacterium]